MHAARSRTALSRIALSRVALSRVALSRVALTRAALTLACLALLFAACGDGGEQAARDGNGGSAASSSELAELELALATLNARLTRLEDAVEELTLLLGGDTTLLGDLPELLEELRLSSALFEVAFRRLDALESTESDEDPCEAIGYAFCPEDPQRLPYAQ